MSKYRDATPEECACLTKDVCPFCKSVDCLQEGPRGGLAVNVRCSRCLSVFNFTPITIQIIREEKLSAKNKREKEERKALAGADALTEEDRRDVRQLVEFVLYCQHGSPRTGDVNCVAPTARKLQKRFDLKLVHYDREHPEG
jgi:hypothetical protein